MAQALEDELGDVLEKAMKHAGFTEQALARATGIDAGRLKDAEDYRYDLSCDELRRIARVLGLNEVGFCALGSGSYPLPCIHGLPFCLHVLAIPYGVGVVNAYLICSKASGRCILFDTGPHGSDLERLWPKGVGGVEAVFLTHGDGDHVGGLDFVLSRHAPRHVYGPARGPQITTVLNEKEEVVVEGLRVRAYRTPGHAAQHNSYLVAAADVSEGRKVMVGGDLLFAGSLGGAFHSKSDLLAQARRILAACAPDCVLAPGHGPLTTIENERCYNPFAA